MNRTKSEKCRTTCPIFRHLGKKFFSRFEVWWWLQLHAAESRINKIILIKDASVKERDIANQTISSHKDVRINLTLVPDHFHRFFSSCLCARFLRRRRGATVSFISAVSFAFRRLLCFLPLPGIKLRGGCLYSRGFSNYMFNLSFRPRLAPGIFRRGRSQE